MHQWTLALRASHVARTTLPRVIVVVCLFACGGKTSGAPGIHEEAGAANDGSSASTDGSLSGDAAAATELGGTWDGFVENFSFASGSNSIVMLLSLGADGHTVTGSVTFGMGTPPPPASDAG
jgi:hypothetical protein